MKTVNDFYDYKIMDMGNGKKLENWNGVLLSRPDPQIIWKTEEKDLWRNVHAEYNRSNTGGGKWNIFKDFNNVWQVKYRDMTFNVKLMNFKHTGLFPEQAYNWNFIREKLEGKNAKVLNLFAYTGASTVASLKAGASVVHVDSSKGMTDWAKENVETNNLKDKPVRYIVEDVVKFVKREIRRGNKYDAIIMDPPSFGKGKKQEIWKFEDNFYELLELVTELLSDEAIFVLISTYTTGLSSTIIENCLSKTVNKKISGTISSDEIGIVSENNLKLPCGIVTRWERN